MTNQYKLPEPISRDDTEHGKDYYTTSDVQAAYRAGLADAAQWLPIETAPRDGTKYLAYHKCFGQFVQNHPQDHYAGEWIFDSAHNQWRGHAHDDDREATRWMPLPAAPKPSAGGQEE